MVLDDDGSMVYYRAVVVRAFQDRGVCMCVCLHASFLVWQAAADSRSKQLRKTHTHLYFAKPVWSIPSPL